MTTVVDRLSILHPRRAREFVMAHLAFVKGVYDRLPPEEGE